MFKELFALTERAPVLLLLTREGDKLRVNINRKHEKGEKEVPLSLSIVATPAELDAELPLALAEGFALGDEEAKPVSVADQVKGQAAASKSESRSSSSTKSKRPPKHKAATKRKPRPAAPAKAAAPKKSAPAARATKPKPPKVAGKAKTAGAMVPSELLAAVIGAEPVGYNEAVKKVWEYIKTKGLQDPKNKRKITSDDALTALAGGKKLAVENLGKVVKANLSASTPGKPEPMPLIRPLLPPEKLREEAARGTDAPIAEPILKHPLPAETAPPQASTSNPLDLFD